MRPMPNWPRICLGSGFRSIPPTSSPSESSGAIATFYPDSPPVTSIVRPVTKSASDGRQEADHLGLVRRLRHPPQRCRLDLCRLSLRRALVPVRPDPFRQRQAGRDRVDVDPERPELERQLAGERDDPALRRGIGAPLATLMPRPAIEARLTIFPEFCRFITGTTAWVNRNVPSRLKRMTRCQSSSECSSTVADGFAMIVLPPTALTRMSIRPNSRTTPATTASTCP